MAVEIKKVWKGKSFTVNGEKRYALFVWQFVAIGLLGVLVFMVYRDGRVMSDLAQQQYLVFEVDQKGSVRMRDASEYQVGPLQVEVEGRAIDNMRWIVGAGSKNIDTAFAEAKRGMTDEMQRQFESERGEDFVEKTKKLNIYRIVSEIDARALKPEDLPVAERQKTRISKYDVVVYGVVNTYRSGSNEWLDESRFALRVTMQPQESRTKENMSALKIDNIADLDAKQVMNVNSNQSAAGTDPGNAAAASDRGKAQSTSANSNNANAEQGK